jgi:transposase InsO family protein
VVHFRLNLDQFGKTIGAETVEQVQQTGANLSVPPLSGGTGREPPRFLIHDRDSRYGAVFDQRLCSLGIRRIRTPFRSPRANAIAERWVSR